MAKIYTFNLKQGNLAPVLPAILKDETGVFPALPGATITFSMKTRDLLTTIVDNQPVEIVDAEQGLVNYNWQEGDTDTPGKFYGEFTAILADGTPVTFPNNTYIHIEILAALS